MYFSLNKKIFYTVFVLLIFMAILFLTIFLNIYGKKYQEDQNSIILRNQYVMELLYENIALRRELANSKINKDVLKNVLEHMISEELIHVRDGIIVT